MGRHSKIQIKDGFLKIKCSDAPRKEHKGAHHYAGDSGWCNDICDMGLADNIESLVNGTPVAQAQTRNLDTMYNPLTGQCFKCNGGAVATTH